MWLAVSYKSICYALGVNTNIIKRGIREKIMIQQFFILYNNINFYEYIYDTSIFNQKARINYIVGYISFFGPYEQSENEYTSNCIWQN